MADGARIRGVDPLTLGLAKGIPAGVDAFFRAQDLQLRRGRFSREEEEARRREEERARQRAILEGAPGDIRTLLGGTGGGGGGLAPSATPAGAFTPRRIPGGGGAEGTIPGGPLEAGLQGGRSATPTPRGPGSLADVLGTEAGSQAFVNLQQGGFKPADLRSKILAEERVGAGRKQIVQAIGLMRDAATSDDKITAAALFYQGLVGMGQTADIGSFVKFLDTEEERTAMKRDLERFGKTMVNLTASGEEVDIQERFDFIDQILSAESRFFREKAAELVSGAVFNVLGPEALVLKTYAEFRKNMDVMPAWRRTEQTVPAQAAKLLSDKKGPREVMDALNIQLEQRKAEARRIGGTTQLDIELKQARLKLLQGENLSLDELIKAAANVDDLLIGMSPEDRKRVRKTLGARIAREAEKLGTEDLPKANKPPKTQTDQSAVAEARRLIAEGHTNESAVRAMKEAGWNVEL